MTRRPILGIAVALLAAGALPGQVRAQAMPMAPAAGTGQGAPVAYVNGIPPVMDHMTYMHALLDQFEARYGADGGQFRYDGQAWYGTDYDKLWLKSEGTVGTNGQFGDGDHEALYDRAISRYFDVQTGVRLDIDNGPTRAWGAVGVEGLALYFFNLEATSYFSDRGAAGRLQGSYDLLLTNRLILQPQVEMNVYSTNDRARGAGRGLSDIDTGLRLRYEWHRKFAPYLGVTYHSTFDQAASMARTRGQRVHDLTFVFGIRAWF
ncbi:copper resistance B precursor [Gluconacetobacter diazotrophicus PA1 5]|uniref:Copper resistance protein B n=2 Tax=Gluconacetobacter diazotrophicus TaxID=33996 RepID=A0A7W4I6F3_GLUDI|nr:copper resistance protein B [Gluconacetobacter diazotrophicus]ACI51963.1 copper resistance B precursor [Gluconacetobacter diazotrophicus PA1 5]MBB2157134.1 copper resistance protein B [Gluconacetobacter diazotrophicus]TWB05132.1 copper resistance protein B [Gluconacetobacter diazotrophicus]CAP55452.1 putative copper resistance protein B [Gluconacetobacter diazotrophicus PA1 5]